MPSTPRHRRKSLAEQFPDLELSPSKTLASSSVSPVRSPKSPSKSVKSSKSVPKMQNLQASLSKAFSAGRPAWRSIRSDPFAPDVGFTIKMAQHLKEEAMKTQLPEDPATIIQKFRDETQRGDVVAFAEVWSELENVLILIVYGSNFIESAGQDLPITIRICQDVFRGREVSPDVLERGPEYQQHLENLLKTHRKGDMPSIIRSRLEVINHAKALNYMIDHVVLNNRAISEAFILETHRILLEGVGGDVKPGAYRDYEVAVCYSKPGGKKKNSVCIRAKTVPAYMKKMVEDLQNDIINAEEKGEIDPYTLAARYNHQFVMIHPFGDGNGRVSRIILNALLLKYAGHLTAFGSDDCEKDEYLDIVRRGHKTWSEEDMEVDDDKQTSHLEFSDFVLKKSASRLSRMWSWATHGGKDKGDV